MPVANLQKTVKKIWKNLENTGNFQGFKPNWTLDFEDGTKAKLTLSQDNAEDLCAKLAEGSTYTFTLETGEYNGKAWTAIRDVMGTHVSVKTPGNGTPGPKTTHTNEPLAGVTIGNIFNNATLLVCARVNGGQIEGSNEAIVKDLNFFCEHFEKQIRRGTFTF